MSKQIRRGDVYYIVRNYTETGSEQHAGRPAIVVSNDHNNAHCDVIDVVYLTTQPKTELPTHCKIRVTDRESTALCEHIHSVYADRFSGYITTLTPQEMADVDACVMVALGLDKPAGLEPDNSGLKAERDFYKARYDELLDRLIGGAK